MSEKWFLNANRVYLWYKSLLLMMQIKLMAGEIDELMASIEGKPIPRKSESKALFTKSLMENIESESKISYSSMLSWWNTLLSTQLFYGMLCFIVGNIMWIGMKHLDFGIYLMLMLSTNQTNSGIDWKMLSLLSLCEIA